MTIFTSENQRTTGQISVWLWQAEPGNVISIWKKTIHDCEAKLSYLVLTVHCAPSHLVEDTPSIHSFDADRTSVPVSFILTVCGLQAVVAVLGRLSTAH